MDTARLSDAEILGLTGWAEARGDADQATHLSVIERLAVMCVVRNRLARFAEFRATAASYRDICLAPLQFSCWSVAGGRLNFAALVGQIAQLLTAGESTDPLLTETLFFADGIVSGAVQDVTGGATAYFAPSAMVPVGSVPTWAKNRTDWLQLGSQRFYKI